MIQSFDFDDTRSLYEGRAVKKWEDIRKQAERRLQILDSATSLHDLRALPSNRFKALHRDRKG